MPLLTVTVDDPSPLLAYSPTGWTQGSSQTDTQASNYYQSSFHPTNVAGSTVSFTFNGTGVQIFGARRGNHGNFQITIDNSSFPAISGLATTDAYQDALFSTTTLSQGLHTITLTNQPTDNNHKFVDIDFITWQSKIGKDGDQLVVQTFQDMDPAFVYDPTPAWSTTPDKIGLFSGGTGHSISSTTGGSFSYTFEGDGVQLYGPVSPNGAPYSVQIDGGSTRQFSASSKFYTPQMMLFHADNLGDSKHTLKLEYQPTASNQQFAIDYANVIRTSSMSSAQVSQTGASSRLSGGIIAGIVVPVLIIVGCVVIAAVILIRRRSRQAQSKGAESSPWYQGFPSTQSRDNHLAFGSTSDPRMAYDVPVQSRAVPAASSTSPSNITFTSIEQSSTSFGRRSTIGRSYYTSPSEYTSAAPYSEPEIHAPPSTLPLSSGVGTRPLSTNSTNPRPANVKGQTVLMPTSAGQNLTSIPEDELRANRLEVDGRVQDFGSSPGPSHEQAPPDYAQATEPYVPRTVDPVPH